MVVDNYNIRVTGSGFDNVAKKMRRTAAAGDGMAGSLTKANQSLRFLQNTLFVVGGAGFVRQFARTADTMQSFANRLRLVTNNSVELANTQQELFRIAKDTRTAFSTTATVFTRTAFNTRELGLSMKETLGFTKLLNKAILISGASAREAEAATIQLSQAIASDRFSGDELRSVFEQLPFVADVIAKGFNVTRGELRALAKEGKVTAKSIIDSFTKSSSDIENKFGNLRVTIGQALANLRTEIFRTFNTPIQGGFGEAIVDSIVTLTERLSDILKLVGIATAAFVAFRLRGLAPLAAAAITNAAAISKQALSVGALSAAYELSARQAVQASNIALAAKREEIIANSALIASIQAGTVVRSAETGAIITLSRARAAGAALEAQAHLAIVARTAAHAKLNVVLASQATVMSRVRFAAAGLIGVLGGPLGAAITAAGLAFTFLTFAENDADRFEDTLRKVKKATDDVAQATQRWGGNLVVVRNELQTTSITQLRALLNDARDGFEGASNSIQKYTTSFYGSGRELRGELIEPLAELRNALKTALVTDNPAGYITAVVDGMVEAGTISVSVGRDFLELADNFIKTSASVTEVTGLIAKLNGEMTKAPDLDKTFGLSTKESKDKIGSLRNLVKENVNVIKTSKDLEKAENLLLARQQELQKQLIVTGDKIAFVNGLNEAEAAYESAKKSIIENSDAVKTANREAVKGAAIQKRLAESLRDVQERVAVINLSDLSADLYRINTDFQKLSNEAGRAPDQIEKLKQSFDKLRNGRFAEEIKNIAASLSLFIRDASGYAQSGLQKDLQEQAEKYQKLTDSIKEFRDAGGDASVAAEHLTEAQIANGIAVDGINEKYDVGAQFIRGIREEQQALTDKQIGLTAAFNSGEIGLFRYNNEIERLFVEQNRLNENDGIGTFAEGARARLFEISLSAQNVSASILDIGSSATVGAIDTLSSSLSRAVYVGSSLRDILASVGKTIVTTVIQGFVKLGAEYVVLSTLRTSLFATEKATETAAATGAIAAITAASIAAAVATAQAWAPAAALLATATSGASAVAGQTALLSILAFAKGAAFGGFAEGGRIGGIGTGTSDSNLALVSRGEFVINAEATQQNLGLLEAINSGKSVTGGQTVIIAPNVVVEVTGGADGAETGNVIGRAAADEVVSIVQRTISDSMRPGGQLARG